ncbi:MAG: 16S rRNA (adenine(1518)-N(6)/adenine(1519)-N(6))-dimethyltransferase RsmA [Mycoplasmoidaceae bacterium]|nr:16S rRNA (adenine(1518)-N(6)/adenine(1519)-N(6))-dimethyltransferase RsmA [Mycoplasmoidaceae bacterium]
MENIRQTLKNKKFLPSKKMGQNFLSNQNIVNEICSHIPNLEPYDCILEIGPGLGAITNYLVTTHKPVICVELDKRLCASLSHTFKNTNIKLINDDFLELDLDKVASQYKRIIVIANIPYSITTPIILKCLANKKIKTLYIMVQKEVADKWVFSKPSNRNASTNIINYYFDMHKVMTIKNTNFVPVPKVDSAMVLLNKKNQETYDPAFYKFIRPFFLAKRKKLINNIPPTINKSKLTTELIKLGFDSNVRSEQLDYNQ